ncbi:MAG: MerR family transcriptional regulator [Alphaproteobacteria bacterium]|jgi:chaperone modulatory protein CbpM|nr:MerR family transcriptional regulator [Alphaproteobacteria bacterium]MBT5390479.1 MerR family transcriptional regulator [Alphaproteobacteria bacterium]MBT5541129.1 MerR family transcriptional regulator [Alphaproteobacteria bacterium]MBT5654966.1 MerR family transcriptional regulator [Alphaproteobacteria bacterium]
MRYTYTQITTTVGLEDTTLRRWVKEEWIIPQEDPEGPFFTDVDLARIQLISELKRDFQVNDESVPLILSLLDQLYTKQAALEKITEVLQELPEETRNRLGKELEKLKGNESENR